MADGRESPSSARVRDLIFAYERHSSSTKPLEEYNGRPRAKSIGNALSYKLFRQPNVEFYSIIDIEKELVKIEAHLNYYEVYEKETHVAFQEQLFNVLTSLVNIDPEDQEGTVQLKKKLILETQKLATDLNSRLPFDGSHSYKGARRTYSSYVRKEEAVVSTTSVRSHEHRAILSSQNSTLQSSTLNGGFKSEESLNSTKDSVDLSSRHDESSIDYNYSEEMPQSSTPPVPQNKIVDETQSGVIPSVSKLKKFFSFRKEAKPEIKVTSASYSGLSRSQSLNIKTNKNIVVKKNKKGERKKGEAISETDESLDQNSNQNIEVTSSTQTINSSQKIHSSQTISTSQSVSTSQTINASQSINATSLESKVYIEPVKEVEEYEEEHNEATLNVSVSKLKGLFERNQNETNEGLGILTKKQTDFSSALDLPFTAMNLGAYRLKRTISGNYMNFTGLIRNVDINKKGGDLSKSKSLSNLKIMNYGYEAKDSVNDELDLSKELDDNDDFEHVSIDVGKETTELNNNVTRNDEVHETIEISEEPVIREGIQITVGSSSTEKHSTQEVSTSETSQTVLREAETIFLSKSVETLKQQFESLSTNSGLTSQETSEAAEHIVYKTKIEPVSNTHGAVVEPVLKVPIQLRPGFTDVSHTEVIESSSISTTNDENNDDIKHIIHKTIEPISSTTDGLEEPKLRVPIQLRPGFSNVNSSLETSSEISNVTETFIRKERVAHEISETVSSGGIVETLKQTFENISSTGSNDLNNEDIRHTIHRTIEPIPSNTIGVEEPVLKVPIRLRVGVGNVSSTHEVTERNTIISSAETAEAHNEDIHRTIEPIPSIDGSEEPVLKVPIQLRIGNMPESQSQHEASEITEESSEHTYTVQKPSDSLASPGTVEILTQTFENLSFTSSSEVNNDDIKHNIHRVIEPISSTDSSEEPVLRVPIQLRIGIRQESQTHETLENSEITEESTEHTYTVQEPSDSLASPGTVDILTQTFENLSFTSSSEVNNDDIKHNIHRVIEPISSTDSSKEPVLRVPIQLRVGIRQESQTHETLENSELVTESTDHSYTVHEASSDSLATQGTVEILTQSFENLGSTHSSELTNNEVKNIIHRTVEPIASVDGSEEPVLKVPIQMRIGIARESQSHEAIENTEVIKTSTEHSNTVQETSDSLASQGTVEILTQTFENMSFTDNSEVNNDDINHIIHKTIEPIPSNSESSDEPVLKVPIQLRSFTYEDRSGGSEVNHGIKHVIHKTEEAVPRVPSSPRPVLAAPVGFAGSLEVVENGHISGITEIFLQKERRYSDELTEHKTEINHQEVLQENTQTQEQVLKVPIELRIGNSIATTETKVGSGQTIIEGHESVPMVNVTFSNNNQNETFTSKDGSMSRSRIEEKTGSFMRVLESPSELSSTVSSSFLSQSQQASSTKVSVSYSEKRTVQQTSSVSQRTVLSTSSSSSLSSQHSGQSYLQVLEEPVSYSLLRSLNPDGPSEESTVSITEVDGEVNSRRKIKVNLNVSQENIIDEILKDGDSLENIDEEFEKMLQENSN